VDALVVTVDRGRYTVRLREEPDRVVTAMKSRPLGRKGVVVGDRVRLVGDTTGDEGSLARIVEVQERTTVLRRTADDDDPVERVIVANAEQLVVVVALAEPEPRTGLVDRAIAAAYDAGIEPLLCLTKADLADPAPLVEVYRPLDVAYVVTQRGADVAPVLERLVGRTSVLLGHSGVGKSTLVNALVPGADRAVGVVNDVTGRGRHTSTSALMLRLPEASGGGWIVDTPGIRSFGLAHLQPQSLLRSFPDLDDLAVDCPRGCTHAASEPECALDEAVAAGTVEEARVSSYRRLLSSRDAPRG
jgi:ribosome biogenesis GTPase